MSPGVTAVGSNNLHAVHTGKRLLLIYSFVLSNTEALLCSRV